MTPVIYTADGRFLGTAHSVMPLESVLFQLVLHLGVELLPDLHRTIDHHRILDLLRSQAVDR
jgi:hypothetical protein